MKINQSKNSVANVFLVLNFSHFSTFYKFYTFCELGFSLRIIDFVIFKFFQKWIQLFILLQFFSSSFILLQIFFQHFTYRQKSGRRIPVSLQRLHGIFSANSCTPHCSVISTSLTHLLCTPQPSLSVLIIDTNSVDKFLTLRGPTFDSLWTVVSPCLFRSDLTYIITTNLIRF